MFKLFIQGGILCVHFSIETLFKFINFSFHRLLIIHMLYICFPIKYTKI